ncbi:hypothetical protein [Akkermansia muciniphila]|uniref:hypothetical protein n=3 Tax=Akkermansia muciniphila TaxID=239935 RepID=UPI00080C7101|nr:hypothetical protein [Akkermansia muciniphila]ANU60724.1 hypothetical protein A4V05_04315 [Akkermansia muciniphila]ASB34219.1 hypothetical protein ADH72_00045 [Akkermansia muciniphila]QQR33806.1 hypothetical protein I5Q85_03060 [Akkermansia muciniphila]WAK79014.1 tail length tape measure protein [Akkermansia phage Chambord]
MSDRNLNINIRTTADTSGATQAAASLDRIRESGESISQTSGVMDRIADSLSRVKTAAGETGDAMKDGMGAEYEKALENANSKLDQYADALTAAGSRMKAAFNDNPGLTGFIDEVTNAVLTSEEFRKKLEQVDDVFEVLNNKMSDLDLGAKWGDDLDENLQQIIDGYNKEMDAADKAAEKAEAAEARKQQAAAATVERLEANNRRASATYEELQAELESYIAKLEEARKAGDNVAQADALKNIQDLGRRIKTAGDAGQLTSTQVKGLAGQITIAATRILGMSSSLRGAIPFIHLFGTTIKTAMGPLGWAMLLIQGLTAGITALIDHFKAKSDELERQAEQATERMKKRARDTAESIKKSYEAIQDYNKADRTQEINKGFEDFVKGITTQYRLQTQEIERQIQLRREEAARQKGIDTQEAELARVKLDNDFEDGKITERQRDYGMMMINQNLDDKIRRRDLEVAQKEFMDYGKQLDTAVQNRDRLQDKDFDMKFIQGQMPSLQEVRGLFNQQQKAQERIDAANRELKKMPNPDELKKQIDNLSKIPFQGIDILDNSRSALLKELKEKQEKQQRLLSARDTAQDEGNAANVRIDELRDLFRQSGVNFEPSYKRGTDVTSRTGEYQKALEDQNSKAKELADKLADAREEAGKLGDIMGAYERNIVDQERSIRTQDQLNSANIDLFNKRADKKEAQEAKKAQEKLEKEHERELKKLQREQQKDAKNTSKTFVQGLLMKTGESSSPQQSDLANKALDAIRKNIEAAAADGHIDEAEMRELGKLYVAKLQELGLATKRAVNGLKEELTQGLRGINAQIDAIGKWANTTERQKRPGGIVNLPYRKR